MSRKFKLINSVGGEYDLCNTSHYFNAPDGLGFDRALSSLQIGSAFVPIEDNLNQQIISGEMIFKKYELYTEFAKFISSGNLELAYQPINNEAWYYRSCRVKSLSKGEISMSTHRLHCNIDFICFSQWYESVTVGRTASDNQQITAFPLTFPFTFYDLNVNCIDVFNGNNDPAPCCIEICGPCENPHWELNQGDISITGEVDITINEGERLVIDANVESMRIELVGVDGTAVNVYQYSNFSTERFVYAPCGKSKITFTHSGSDALNAAVEVRQVADTV